MNRAQYLNALHAVRVAARSVDMLPEYAPDRECERRYTLYSAAIARCPTGLTLRGPQHGRFALDAQFPAWFRRREDLRIRRARASQVAA
jgi:hypothetical protein